MAIKFIAWFLIIFGLMGVMSGAVMAFSFFTANNSAAKDAEMQARMNPNAIQSGPGKNPDALWQFGSAGLSCVIGGIAVYGGFRLRRPAKHTSQRVH